LVCISISNLYSKTLYNVLNWIIFFFKINFREKLKRVVVSHISPKKKRKLILRRK
jgi:hypothetical protein